jgi:hypothetical protein
LPHRGVLCAHRQGKEGGDSVSRAWTEAGPGYGRDEERDHDQDQLATSHDGHEATSVRAETLVHGPADRSAGKKSGER